MHTIRLANREDLARVSAIIRNATQSLDEQGIPQWDEVYPNDSTLRTDIEEQHLYVIEEAGAVAGMIALNEDQPPEYAEVAWLHPGRVLVVHRLAVDPRHQGRRLASQLMEFAERRAAAEGYATIRLDAFTLNPAAVALYRRRGFSEAGTVRLRKGLFFCFEKAVSG